MQLGQVNKAAGWGDETRERGVGLGTLHLPLKSQGEEHAPTSLIHESSDSP